jgi:hypothetical protein
MTGINQTLGTAYTHLDRSRRPYIYVSIDGGRKRFFLIPTRSKRPERAGEYLVKSLSPLTRVRPSGANSRTARARRRSRALSVRRSRLRR